jgi:hypothetical protein
LPKHFIAKANKYIAYQEKLENELHIFYNFFVILYADDTVILSETKEGMQQALDIFESYCKTTSKCCKNKSYDFLKKENCTRS